MTTAEAETAPRLPRPLHALLALLLALLLAALALPLIRAVHDVRPAPYGDRLTVHAHPTHPKTGTASEEPALQKKSRAVVAYDTSTRRPVWTHTRGGRRPLAVLPAPGHAFTLWDDGLVTDTARTGSAVRWHRAIPAGADWLRTPAARGGAGVLRVLDRASGAEAPPGAGTEARMLAVVTPQRITAYRAEDGDLRWVLPARTGCAFEPARAVHRAGALLVAQPCGEPDTPWSEQLVAVDDLGRVVPDRKPLGNALPPEKVLAHPR
ncbi:hypothetical protein [Streptomyces cavernicola]|uniref:Uncharacterized protein n=1 Tax=Streptomyces cavernicola TaxID=3043613 RepID=A0ABT6S9T4_9ACTN|nr:hypothetical protein [Streptomyces sp. B-S-A6]MDI3404908.1 hypothetical protein [Streptomyces sp. B-S-A6]